MRKLRNVTYRDLAVYWNSERVRANERLLSASYNLAAIYALLGHKARPIELLFRHFYRHERYDQGTDAGSG